MLEKGKVFDIYAHVSAMEFDYEPEVRMESLKKIIQMLVECVEEASEDYKVQSAKAGVSLEFSDNFSNFGCM